MKNTFKILLLSLFTTTIYSLESKEFIRESDFTLSESDSSIKCGFLEVKSPFRTNKIVRATRNGCFRWVFSKNGKVTSISDFIVVKKGEVKRGFSQDGQTVEINCHCRSKKANF